MTKTEMLRQLPSAAPSAVEQMKQLEQTIIHLDRALAIAINRLESQQDAMASDLLPLVELRDQMTSVLADAFRVLKNLTDSAKRFEAAQSEVLSELREQAQLLVHASQSCKRPQWKYSLVAGLSAAVLVAGSLVWYLPSPNPLPPSISIDTQVLSDQILQKWAQRQQRQADRP